MCYSWSPTIDNKIKLVIIIIVYIIMVDITIIIIMAILLVLINIFVHHCCITKSMEDFGRYYNVLVDMRYCS